MRRVGFSFRFKKGGHDDEGYAKGTLGVRVQGGVAKGMLGVWLRDGVRPSRGRFGPVGVRSSRGRFQAWAR